MRPFRHINAGTLDEAVAARQEKAMIIAGGTDCLGLLKNKVLPLYPAALVNIKNIPGLNYIEEDSGGLRIGALAKLADLASSPVVREKYGVLAEAANSVASPQIRNMGTLGGNLCQEVRCLYYRCSPLTGRDYFCLRKGGRSCFAVTGDNRYHAILGGKGCFAVGPSDTAVALSALEAKIAIKGANADRLIPIADFFTVLGNVLGADEMVQEIQVPGLPAGGKQAFRKFRLRKAIDFAVVSLASLITVERGACEDARIVIGAVAPTPFRAREAEEAIRGKSITAETAGAAANAAVAGALPLSMNAYKIEITKTLVKRAILDAARE